MYELTVVVTACIRLVKAQDRRNSSIEKGVACEVLPISKEFLVIICCGRFVLPSSLEID